MKRDNSGCLVRIDSWWQVDHLRQKIHYMLNWVHKCVCVSVQSEATTFLNGVIPQGLSGCSGSPVITRRPAGSDWTCTCYHQIRTKKINNFLYGMASFQGKFLLLIFHLSPKGFILGQWKDLKLGSPHEWHHTSSPPHVEVQELVHRLQSNLSAGKQ